MTAPSAPRRRPAGRYDEPSRIGQRALAVLLGALFLAFVAAILLTLFARYGRDSLSAKVFSYNVQSDSRVVLDLEVAKQPGDTAYCVIRARGRDGAEVGRDVAVLDAAGTPSRTVRSTFALATTARAVTGEVAGCRTEPLSAEDIAP